MAPKCRNRCLPPRGEGAGSHPRQGQMIASVAHEYNIDRHAFGDYIENVVKPALGKRARDTLTYKQLRQAAEHYLEEHGK